MSLFKFVFSGRILTFKYAIFFDFFLPFKECPEAVQTFFKRELIFFIANCLAQAIFMKTSMNLNRNSQEYIVSELKKCLN